MRRSLVALEVGCSYSAQEFHVDHGHWERVDRGIFWLAALPVRRSGG